jgi:hypothetical protein
MAVLSSQDGSYDCHSVAKHVDLGWKLAQLDSAMTLLFNSAQILTLAANDQAY